jgi:tetratricopeptide (TPR) repeat protein
VYAHALRDELYDRRGAVYANLGAAHFALAEYADAVAAYENALRESDYATPHKALQGMASALLERGRVEEAAAAYRRAALEPGNPDPGKALLNLGLCFMALNRPADAVDAYQAALGFDEYKGRGKALANLGQAYFALGEYEQAVKAFEKATQLHAHGLQPAAGAAYAKALELLRESSAPEEDVVDSEVLLLEPTDTAESSVIMVESLLDADLHDDEAVSFGESSETIAYDAEQVASELGFGDEESVADFFSVTEDQLRERDRHARRVKRAEGGASRRRGVVITVLVVLVLTVIGAGTAWYTGFGWPTQEQVVSGMLSAYSDGESVTSYWVAVPESDVTKEIEKISLPESFSVANVDRGQEVSTVIVTVVSAEGTSLNYAITLAREGVGWKVTGIDNDWQSADAGGS